MAEPVRARRLTDQEGQRLLQIVRRGKPESVRVFLYAPAASSADEAGQVARQVLARHDVSASVRTEFWSSLKEEWRDVTDEPSADPVAERRAVGREMSRKAGFPAWQVRVDVRSHRDVVALAGYLAALRTCIMSNSDYGISPRWPASCRPACAGATPKARYPDMLAAQRRERARIGSERQQRWGRPKPKAA